MIIKKHWSNIINLIILLLMPLSAVMAEKPIVEHGSEYTITAKTNEKGHIISFIAEV